VKARLGLLDAPTPSARPLSGQWNLLGSPDHRNLAREAVRKSLVLLRNDGVLPLAPGGRRLVAGDVARQSGGWTLTWQGTGLNNEHFPGATSLWAGLRNAVAAGGGSAELSPDGSFTRRPDAAVVVFGERPYAEFQGDRATLALDAELTGPYATMRRLREQGIPVVAVMITGRPLYVNEALNNADAFVVTWLPGSEGGNGLADVLVGDAQGQPRFDFSGTLPADWPRTPVMADGVLYPRGHGLTYASPRAAWTDLPLVAAQGGDSRTWFAAGVPANSWSLYVTDPGAPGSQTRVTTVPAAALDGRARITAVDTTVQEGARRFQISGGDAAISLGNFNPVDIARETNGAVLLVFTVRLDQAPEGLALAMRGADGTLASVPLSLTSGSRFVRYGMALRCLRTRGIDMASMEAPFVLATHGAADLSLAEARLGTDAEVVLPCP
jgi:beta-glucosidase